MTPNNFVYILAAFFLLSISLRYHLVADAAPYLLLPPKDDGFAHYCRIYPQLNLQPDITVEADTGRCLCHNRCLIKTVRFEMYLWEMGTFGKIQIAKEETYQLYSCVEGCFRPYTSALNLPRNQRFPPQSDRKTNQTSEGVLYRSLASVMDGNNNSNTKLYKTLIERLNSTYLDDNDQNKTTQLIGRNAIPQDVGSVCFEENLWRKLQYIDIGLQLERTLYCRKITRCFKQLASATYFNSSKFTNCPDPELWNLYECIRVAFLESSPLRENW